MSIRNCYVISKRVLGIDNLPDALRGHWQHHPTTCASIGSCHRYSPRNTAPAPHSCSARPIRQAPRSLSESASWDGAGGSTGNDETAGCDRPALGWRSRECPSGSSTAIKARSAAVVTLEIPLRVPLTPFPAPLLDRQAHLSPGQDMQPLQIPPGAHQRPLALRSA